jgi:Tol biopolymer transport system component
LSGIQWAPDNRSFAADATDLKGRKGIYRIDVQTGASEPVVQDVQEGSSYGYYWNPRWAPGGKSLYYGFATQAPPNAPQKPATIYRRDLATGTEHEVVRNETPSFTGFAPSPDGRYLAYALRNDTTKTDSVMLVSLSGGEPQELLRAPVSDGLAFGDWTPDSAAIFFRKSTDGNQTRSFWLAPIAGGAPRKIDVPDPRARGVLASPDGRQIVYSVPVPGTEEIVAMENFLPTLSGAK